MGRGGEADGCHMSEVNPDIQASIPGSVVTETGFEQEMEKAPEGTSRGGDSAHDLSPRTAVKWGRLAHEALNGIARFEDDGVKMEKLLKLFQREVNKGFIFKELFPYCTFLLFMLIVVMVSRSEEYDANIHRTLEGTTETLLDGSFAVSDSPSFKKTFWDITTQYEFWQWMRQPLLTALWDDTGNTVVNTFNKPLGFIVLRQYRVKRESCKEIEAYNGVSSDIRGYLPTNCYPDYHCSAFSCSLSEDVYGTGRQFRPLELTNPKLDFVPLTGLFHEYKYPHKSFVHLIPVDNITREEAWNEIQSIRDGGFIDHQTRLVSVEIIFLNRNYDVFQYLTAFCEINSGGLWTPQSRIIPFKFLSLKSGPTGVAIFILDIVVTLYFVYIFFRLGQTLVRNWKLHGEILTFFAFWNTYALGDMILFMVTYGYRWYCWHITLTLKDERFSNVEDMWGSLASYSHWYETSWNCYGFACALAIGGLFRFTQYNPRLFLLVETVERALGELLSVVMMMSIVVFAYGILGHLLFGYYLDEYQSFVSSCGTLLRYLIGDFPADIYYRMRSAQQNTWAAVVYLVSYTFIAWCILLNMILAIINESLAAVKAKAGQKDIAIMKWLQKQIAKLHCCQNTSGAETKEQQAARTKLQATLTKEIYEKLKQYKAGPFFKYTLLKKDLKSKIEWTVEEWEFLENFMIDRKSEVFDKEADTPERQKLEVILQQVSQIAMSLQQAGVGPEKKDSDSRGALQAASKFRASLRRDDPVSPVRKIDFMGDDERTHDK
eukprot:TRINITY_DN10277_c0_g2_i3.p1 TRINITY_DN10277_c0_g2~~TRINITY_DN10277_c0_g2_i3.p1  ORF type:complete len:773 (+),score=114.74 TRINITY_DN10277_c0_g2_i3:29-2347(+)